MNRKTNNGHAWTVRSAKPPTVEIDTEASAAYVRFKKAKVVRTIRHQSKWPIVTIDLDSHGDVVGVEFVGVKKFNLCYLLELAGIKASGDVVAGASYVSTETVAA